MADDPGTGPAPRSRRRRRSADEPAVAPPPTPGPLEPPDDTPLPTFVYAAAQGAAAADPGEAADALEADSAPIGTNAGTRSPTATLAPAIGLAPGAGRSLARSRRSVPFLRAADGDRLVPPIEAPDPANRCAALRDAVPQSLRQQELVCLASGHISCPRYLRGAVVVAAVPAPVVRTASSLTTPVLVSFLALILAASASVAFVLARGGLELAAASPSSPRASVTAVAAASASPTSSAAPTATAPPSAAATAAPTASPTPLPSPSPTPSPSPAAPTAAPTAKPTPTSDRYALLEACPGTARCWIYRVRSGDNLYSIAHYFGVSLDSIYARNPWARTQGLRPGRELRLPPPTR